MATNHDDRIAVHPGPEAVGPVSYRRRISPSEGAFGYHSSHLIAAMEGKAMCVGWGGYMQFVPAQWTSTSDSGSINYAATTNGVKFLTGASPTDNDDNALESLAGVTLRASTSGSRQFWKCSTRFNLSSVLNLGFTFGFATQGGTEYNSANPADGVFIIKAKTSAQFILRVVQNSQAAVDQNITLSAADGTDFNISIEFLAGSVADGSDSVGGVWVNNTFTPFTTAQKVELYTMLLTTPPVLSAIQGTRVNSTTQRNGVSNYSLWEVDR